MVVIRLSRILIVTDELSLKGSYEPDNGHGLNKNDLTKSSQQSCSRHYYHPHIISEQTELEPSMPLFKITQLIND